MSIVYVHVGGGDCVCMVGCGMCVCADFYMYGSNLFIKGSIVKCGKIQHLCEFVRHD